MGKLENHTVEFKQSWHDEYLKTIAAFANTEGGIMYIGCDDRGVVIGLEKSETKKLLEDLPNKIRSKLGITPFVQEEIRNGKSLLNIKVLCSSFPVSCDGKFYIRVGSTTQELSGLELSSFLLEKTGDSWDELPTSVRIDQLEEVLDTESIEKFKVLARQRLPLIEQDTTRIILQKLNLITKDGRLTRACILLFGKNPQRYFISAYSKAGRFKNNTIILDTVEVKGNLFQQLDGILEAIKKNINVMFDTSVRELSLEGVARREIWDYPLDALREAAINALVHRDYLDTSSSIEVRIYDDELILSNPGKLMPPLTIEQLKEKHSGRQRNPLIATVFYYANFIESWGSGTLKMINLCKEQNLPEPEFAEQKEGLGQFTVVFHKDIFNEEELRKRGLNERQIKAVKYVKEKGKITNREYQEISKISERTATRDLFDLVIKKIFVQVGSTGKGTNYILKTP
ncbi:MAG: Divergent AAA domain protein [Firmicutes bacterium ADurb.Bin080]|nr:MAG: Divergent AAA domain protein [Firmicutes bacterium ADurb.Bin080]